MMCFFVDSFESGRIREGDVVRAKSNRVREGNGRRFHGRRKRKEKNFCFVVVQFELIFHHPCCCFLSSVRALKKKQIQKQSSFVNSQFGSAQQRTGNASATALLNIINGNGL